ncbi:pilus assembly FimT family protein [Roseateles sp. BYS96W]|uniref:Tfp pilus assembly protein FimT/FimU n=1 Tax=Pelomonas nitida TaxID=3299027 RepID=A0ABW7G1V0_9BURK
MKRAAQHRSVVGVTLVEMAVAVIVLSVIVAVAVPSFSSLIERRRIIATAGEIASIIAFARTEANAVNAPFNLHLEAVPANITDFGSCIRVSAGRNDTCQCNLARACRIGDAKVLRELLLPRGNSVSFAATADWGGRTGVVSFVRDPRLTDVENLVVTVSGARTGARLAVQYSNAGRVRTCSPDGSIGGFPVCS